MRFNTFPLIVLLTCAVSSTTGACSTDGSSGTPNGVTTFGSLFACQTAKMPARPDFARQRITM